MPTRCPERICQAVPGQPCTLTPDDHQSRTSAWDRRTTTKENHR
ncbi:hypothetical protein ABZ922_34580 [Streptomyces shenzhenensis]